MVALFLAEEGFHVLLCGAEFTQLDLRFLVAGVEPVFLRGKGLVFGMVNLISISNGVCSDVLNPAIEPMCYVRLLSGQNWKIMRDKYR